MRTLTIFILMPLFVVLNFSGTTSQLFAQIVDSTNQEVSPKGGVNQLVLEYYKIKFSKEQRKVLKNAELEFIYLVDEDGRAELQTIHGIDDRAIQDSFLHRSEKLPAFNPQITNGQVTESLYFIKFTFPRYQPSQYVNPYARTRTYHSARLEDFEYINPSGERIEMLMGGLMNQFAGSPSQYLSLGGGIKFEIDFTSKKSMLYGLNMSIYGNKMKKEYSINSSRERLSHPSTILIGGIIGKWFNNQKFNAQLEINYAAQNITEKVGDNDPEWVQFRGWSPGIVFNYLLQLGKGKPMYYYGSPAILKHDVNLHLGLRQLFMSNNEASGTMIELGVSYRMIYLPVIDYKFNDDFMQELAD